MKNITTLLTLLVVFIAGLAIGIHSEGERQTNKYLPQIEQLQDTIQYYQELVKYD